MIDQGLANVFRRLSVVEKPRPENETTEEFLAAMIDAMMGIEYIRARHDRELAFRKSLLLSEDPDERDANATLGRMLDIYRMALTDMEKRQQKFKAALDALDS